MGSQEYRNRVSDEFRTATEGVLFTSDLSAQGVDYANVSHVIQFGMPETRDQYVHRLGWTARGIDESAKGTGWLISQDWESSFLRELSESNLDVPPNERLMARLFIGDDDGGALS